MGILWYYGGMILNSADAMFQNLSPLTWVLIGLLVIWTIFWKGLALWKSARLSHKKWFVAFLILNTFGILEIAYIRFIAKKYDVETVDATGKDLK
jgi:hypothetical protein